MNLSEKIPDDQLYPFMHNYITDLFGSHRKTPWYQLEVEQFDEFGKDQVLKYLAKNDAEHDYLMEQFDFSPVTNRVWDIRCFKDIPEISFVPNAELFQNMLTHFRFSVPLISMNQEILIMRVIYQNAFTQGHMNGSDCIELFRADQSGKWIYAGHLYGTSI